MKPNIADLRSIFRGRLQRFADDRLIDIAESDLLFPQKCESFRCLPARVPQFHGEWIIGESLQKRSQISDRLRAAVERKRELHEQGAQFARFDERLKPRTHQALI